MMDKIKVLVVPDDLAQPAHVEEVSPDDLHGMQTLVGGYLEPIQVDNWWTAYCDEEGKIKGLPMNRRATLMAHNLGWPPGDVLCGPVMFCGPPSDGWDTSVPDILIALVD